MQLKMRGAVLLKEDVVAQSGVDVTYVLTPLHDAELNELLKQSNDESVGGTELPPHSKKDKEKNQPPGVAG